MPKQSDLVPVEVETTEDISSQTMQSFTTQLRKKLAQGVNTPTYLRPKEAAIRISVTPAFIYKLLKQGQLKSYGLGRTRLIKVIDLDTLVESHG